MKIKANNEELEFKHLDSTPPEGCTPSNVFTTEAVVDTTPQPLRTLRPFVASCLQIPATAPTVAQDVLVALFDCFAKQSEVKEGLIGDILWGFEQSGVPGELTARGLIHLEKAGYIKFQAPDGAFVKFEDDRAVSAWIRYQPKLLDMVYNEPISVTSH
jgi:hypothetical protein